MTCVEDGWASECLDDVRNVLLDVMAAVRERQINRCDETDFVDFPEFQGEFGDAVMRQVNSILARHGVATVDVG